MPFDFTPGPLEHTKVLRGKTAFLRGQAAEEQVSRVYQRHGARLLQTRWRGQAGEIDLIFQGLSGIICVEVKASATHAQAAQSLRPRQLHRLCLAAEEFLGTQPKGALTPMRFDVALVDGQGQIDILENAVMAS
jgi:putative endonuclease